MKAELRPCRHRHGRAFLDAFRQGFECHGGKIVESGGDFVAMWGHRDRDVIEGDRPYLVLEQGYVGDRLRWTSIGWNGLNGRATFPKAPDGERWERNFGHLMQPWKDGGEYTVVMGQVRGDASIERVDIAGWYEEAAANLSAEWKLPVVFRPHPFDGFAKTPTGTTRHTGPLQDILDRARVVATFNSNSGVDAVLAGIPVIARDRGSMAWPVAAQDYDHCHRPDRTEWAHGLAYAQWRIEEIAAGEAWAHLRGLL